MNVQWEIWMKRNIIALGIVTVLLGLVAAPTISSQLTTVKTQKINKVAKSTDKSELVDITVREYQGDGSYTKVQKQVPIEFVKKLKETTDVDERLRLLKKQGVVSPDASMDTFKQRVHQMAEKLGLTEEKLRRLMSADDSNDTFINLFCKVGWAALPPLCLPVGLSLITGPLNLIWGWWGGHQIPFPSVDLCSVGLSLEMCTKGLLGTWYTMGLPLAGTIGFAGVAVLTPFLPGSVIWIFEGYACIAFAHNLIGSL